MMPVYDFNPRSPCGERLLVKADIIPYFRFQSTLPMRERHVERFMVMPVEKFQSTLPMRGAAGRIYALRKLTMISIHAPHAGSG